MPEASWRTYVNGILAQEISRASRYFDRIIQWQPREDDSGSLLAQIESPDKKVASHFGELESLVNSPYPSGSHQRILVMLNGNLNHDYDIQLSLGVIRQKLTRYARLVLITYNPYLRVLYRLANKLGIRRGDQPTTFLTHVDLFNIARLAGFEVVRVRPSICCPWKLCGIGDLLNTLVPAIPVLRWVCLTTVITLRPPVRTEGRPSLSIVIPARNEKGNIEHALQRMPDFDGADLEIIFVEGHSNDGTWEEIQRVSEMWKNKYQIKTLQQTGKGKSDAVRLEFSQASSELLTILDAYLTMPPELLVRFYKAYVDGLGDFINGSRLVYPMEGRAMRFLNHLGNIFFAKSLSFVLDLPISDSLCGTKLFSRADYQRFISWRKDFGDVDPFGDFELLFPAATLTLGTIDIPIRYRDRTYGTTNISRFKHGAMLLKMTIIGLLGIRLASVRA